MDRIGPYLLGDSLGSGAAGDVFRTSDSSGEQVAIKVLAEHDVQSRKRFLLEVQALTRLRHPNVIRIRDAGEVAGCSYLVMDLIDGPSLKDRLKQRGPLEPREAVELALGLARGLQHIHGSGLLHRDLKPANVLLRSGREPLLADFGLAKNLHPDADRLSQTGATLGTPGFWSPEQVRADQRVGPATDIYSLGATLYAMLTGVPPIWAKTLPEIMGATVLRRPKPPSEANGAVDGELDRICLRCLEKDPALRYATAEELAGELESYLADPLAVRRWKLRAAVWAGVLVLGSTVLGVSVARATAARAALDRANVPAALDASGYLMRGRSRQLDVDGLEASLEDFGRALKLDPQSAASWIAQADAKALRGDLEAALLDCNRALELDPKHSHYFVVRSNVHAGLDDFPAALRDLDSALKLDPDNPRILANRSNPRVVMGDLRGALGDLSRAADLAPKNAMIHLALANVRADTNDPQGALASFADGLAAARDAEERSIVLEGRGEFHHHRRDLDAALKDLDGSLEAWPQNLPALAARAVMRLEAGDAQGAVDDYTRAIEIEPGDPHTYYNRAVARSSFDPKEAVADYMRFLDRAPGHPDTRAVWKEIRRLRALGRN